MTLLDLSLVTQTLIKLIEEYFKASPAWSPSPAPTISPQPPDKVTGDGLGLYLYHFSEDAHFKNLPAPGKEAPPVRYIPMGLNLYYQLSPHSASDNGAGTYLEQKMMGVAVKALHDYSMIDESTEIKGQKIFPPALQGTENRLRIVLQPIPHNEAVSFWTAGTSALRMAAYYQVSVVLLEPEETKSRAGKVLVYGVHTFTEGAPRLESSRNILSFTLPGEITVREIECRPAQAPPAKPGVTPAPAESKVIFKGTGFAGVSTSLLIRNIRWDKSEEADAAWVIAAKIDEVSAIVQEKASAKDILPGIYAATAKVTRQRSMPGGGFRKFEHLSNECPFTITPRIDNISAPDANNIVSVKGYIFKHAELPDKSIQVYLGDTKLEQTTGGTPDPGEFKVVNASSMKLRLSPGLESGKFYPLRIFVSGAESPPNWIRVP